MIGKPNGISDGISVPGTELELRVDRPVTAANVSVCPDGVKVLVCAVTLTPDECGELFSMVTQARAGYLELAERQEDKEGEMR